MDWAAQASSPWARHVRLRDIVLLARFLHAEDPAHEVPPARFFHVRLVRQPPYIYTPAEIGQLLAAAAGLRRTYALRRRVYTTLIGLLAATGLRVSEALDLRLADLLPSGVLRIRKTKFAKSRLVPLHGTSIEALGAYLEARQSVAIADDHLFVSAHHGRIASSTVAAIAPDRQRRPRLLDLRHTFATRSLQQCSTRRESVARHFVALATYLGHADIANTYWYLEATPELMADLATASESLVAGRLA